MFDIYLAKEDQPESDAYAELSLPATPYQVQDAFDKLRLAEGESLYWEITEYHLFEELSAILNDSCGLNDLNALAQRLSGLDEQQCNAFAGLLKMEQQKGGTIPISRLVDPAYSTDCCHVVDEALNDSQLGRFCAESGFFPEAEALPDHVFDLLDCERIGREHRQREGGVFVERTADHPGGYVERRDELLEAVDCKDLQSAEQLIDTLDNYIFSPQYSSPIEVAKGELSVVLNEEDAATLAPHLTEPVPVRTGVDPEMWRHPDLLRTDQASGRPAGTIAGNTARTGRNGDELIMDNFKELCRPCPVRRNIRRG